MTNLETLIDHINRGNRVKYLFFWGHQPRKDGAVGKTCFSQWYAAPFEIDGVGYATAEHYMMAEKARLFHDDAILQKIIQAPNPAAVKKFGREIRGFEEKTWTAHRFQIVVKGNLAKFSQHAGFKEFLLNTGDRVLVEASPVDPIWGIGLAQDHPGIENPRNWKGLNLLGFALMAVREELQQTDAKPA